MSWCGVWAGVWLAGGLGASYHQGPPPRTSDPPRTRNRIPPATTSRPKGPPGPNPARDSHSNHTTSRCRHHTPTWRIHGRGRPPPSQPVPGGTT